MCIEKNTVDDSWMNHVSEENEEKMYALGNKVKELTQQEPQSEYDVLRLIEEYHLDISQFDFPEGDYDSFVKAVHAGFYDVRAWDAYYTESEQALQQGKNTISEEEFIDGFIQGRFSMHARPDDPLWAKIEERRKELELYENKSSTD